ncbi:FMN-binding negative transcriptional regulator [Leisingera sp.]|uniref:FMN-binding negative transcriptional regulator n=1 Tax=Leisingera sp. TaxID=1879318 RepID=UPI002B2717F2|nr:FMN-binding negative transcriptional regulator [Leisingera sp.]
MSQVQKRPYVPRPYAASEDEARLMIRAYPFATVITRGQDTPEATQTPLFFETEDPGCRTLIGHIARANPQAAELMAPGPVLAVFNGPSAYVSPAWYAEDEDVPTWIYRSVHLRGEIEPVEGPGMRTLMERIIASSEHRIGGAWRLSRIPEPDIARMMPRIIGFRIHLSALKGISKLEQTRSQTNRSSVAAALEAGEEIGKDLLIDLLRRPRSPVSKGH